MTSYKPKAKPDPLVLDPALQSESIFDFWKSSKNPRYLGDRRCNRSWRLINDKLVAFSTTCYHKSVLQLHDRPLYTSQHSHQSIIMNRPSLFSDNSKSTTETKFSLCYPEKASDALNSGDDTSDLSEDDEYSDSDCGSSYLSSSKPVNDGVSKTAKECLPVHTAKNQGLHMLAKSATSPQGQSVAAKSNIFFISNSPASPNPLPRNPSASSISNTAFQGGHANHNLGSASAASHSSGKVEANVSCQDSLFGGLAELRSASFDHASSASSSDISEDDEYNSEDDKNGNLNVSPDERDSKTHSGNSGHEGAKNIPIDKIPRSSEDNDSEWISASSEGEQFAESPKPPPLSFGKKYPVSNSSASTLSKSPAASEMSFASSKPRSLLSGLFLNDMNGRASSESSKESSSTESRKPILKRSSTTGVITVEEIAKDEKTVSKSSILYSKRYASLSDVPRRHPPHRSPVTFPINTQQKIHERTPNGKRSDPLFAKQMSQVGLSNLKVLAEGTGSPESRKINQPKVKSAENISLSSSLSKYSSSLNQPSNSSLKNLLSNSAINISSILGQGFSNKLRSGRSSETLKASDEDLSSSFAGYLSRQHSQDSAKTDVPLSRSVRVTPTREFEPSVEISKSLKDSLMIDHKLGKRPMPERVISDEDLFLGHDRESFLQDQNDYHSKGW